MGFHRIQALLGYEKSEITPEEYEFSEYYGDFDSKAEYWNVEKQLSSAGYFWSSGVPQKSIFARVDYELLDRYFLGVIIRQDQGLKGEWKTIQPVTFYDYHAHKELYPSVMAGWSIGNEKFMNKISWINELKIRGSYGKTGDMNANWQYSDMTDLGFESRIFRNHFGISIDWYSNITKDVPVPTAFITDIITGELKFAGVDIDIDYNNRWNDFGFSAGLVFSSYRSRINKMWFVRLLYFRSVSQLQYLVQNAAGHPYLPFTGIR